MDVCELEAFERLDTNRMQPPLEPLSAACAARGGRLPLLAQHALRARACEVELLALRGPPWCPQQPGLVPMLSAFHNIYMGALDRHSFIYNLGNLIKPLPAARREVSEIARSIDLEQQLYSSVDKLSGGQQQRTSIGRALIQQRPIFIGDEPVANVDEYQAERLLRLICQQHQTVVLALHDIEQALQFCTRIIGLKDGAIALDAASDQLTASDLASLYDAV